MKLIIVTGFCYLFYINSCIANGFDPDFPLLWQTRHMKNTTDFCYLLDMDPDECMKVLKETMPVDGVDESGEKMVVSGGATSEIAMFDPCNPRMSTIVVPRHPDNDITVWPTCTRALRCGGCCTSDVFSCEPTEVREKYVRVFDTRLPYVGAHRFQFLGVRSIKILEHVQCDAQCKTKPHECHKYQIYESRKCRCVCHPERLKLMSTCKQEQIWDDSECDCICPNRNTVKCPEPSYFSTTTCKCTLKTEVTGEIDLDLLFAKLGSGIIDLGLDGNPWQDFGQENIDIGDIDGEPIQDNFTEGYNSTNTELDSSSTSSSSTTTSTTTTEATTTTTQSTSTKDPCEHVQCFGNWKAKFLSTGKCQCLPVWG